MIGFCPLASGSKGNCIFFGTDQTRILIDAGISAGAVEKKLAEIQIDIKTIEAILITHEHTDHVRGIPLLSERWNIPVLANAETAKGIIRALNFRPRFKIFTTGEPFSFGNLEIFPFSIPHDTLDPVAFVIQAVGYKFGFCADLGHVTSLVRKMLENCDYLYIEANHQPSMVHASPRPQVYKQRVLGKQGHLSNEECAHLLTALSHKGLKHVHLAHLSSECNSHELALKMAKEALFQTNKEVSLSIAYQDRVSDPVSLGKGKE
jgi:phosphoribosyl 1,2-cyclic phosphodiesterase